MTSDADAEAIEALLAGFRCDDVEPPRIDSARWAAQFEPDERPVLLRVVRRWVERYYWPRERVVGALRALADELDGPVAVVPSQPAMSGQAKLNRMFDRVLRERHVAKHPLTAGARVHVYLDDMCCTGRTADRGLRRLIASVPSGSHVVALHLAEHTHLRGLRAGVEEAARQRGVLVRFAAGQLLESDPASLGGLEVLIPTPWAATALASEYVASTRVTRRAFRERDLFGDGPLYDDGDERDVVERALLRVGSRLVLGSKHVRPLGAGPSGTLGFGAVAFTFQNAPLALPPALWWSDGWFPLVPRRT
jgi:hypothetical protein